MTTPADEARQLQVIAGLRPLLGRVALPSAAIRLDDSRTVTAGGSYLGGHPYLPDGASWPCFHGVPMFFLVQVNFAEVGSLRGFPTEGLFQWFIGADSPLYGFNHDDTQGMTGFEVRWYPDVSAPSTAPPTAPTPWHEMCEQRELFTPLTTTEARALTFEVGSALPQRYEFQMEDEIRRLVIELAQLGGRTSDDQRVLAANGWLDILHDGSPFRDEFVQGSSLGGSAYVTQADPRGYGNYPPIDAPAGQVLITIDHDLAPGWGDHGIAHLFGDPKVVADGDLSSVRYYWDCT